MTTTVQRTKRLPAFDVRNPAPFSANNGAIIDNACSKCAKDPIRIRIPDPIRIPDSEYNGINTGINTRSLSKQTQPSPV
eukprot:876197-Prorocentrum_minimum.AAC.5